MQIRLEFASTPPKTFDGIEQRVFGLSLVVVLKRGAAWFVLDPRLDVRQHARCGLPCRRALVTLKPLIRGGEFLDQPSLLDHTHVVVGKVEAALMLVRLQPRQPRFSLNALRVGGRSFLPKR